MKEVISSNYSIWIGNNSLSKLNIKSYSKVAILVDENTKKNCLYKLPKIEQLIIIEIPSGESNKNIAKDILMDCCISLERSHQGLLLVQMRYSFNAIEIV